MIALFNYLVNKITLGVFLMNFSYFLCCRSPAFAAPPPSRGRDYGGRDYGGGRDIGSRDAGSRDYTRREPRRDYEREPRDYASAPSAR